MDVFQEIANANSERWVSVMTLGREWGIDARTITLENYYMLSMKKVVDNIQKY